MRKAAIVCILFLATRLLHAQKDNHLEVCFATGPAWFVKGKTANIRLGRSEFCGVTYCFQNKKKPMAFTPGIYFLHNEYNSQLDQFVRVRVNQYGLELRPAVRLRVGKNAQLRVGINFMYMGYSDFYRAYRDHNNRNVIYYYNNDVSRGYYSQDFQAGVQVGLGLPFRIYRRMFSFNMELAYYASRLVRSDFVTELLPGKEITVLSTTSRPLALLLGFDIDLRRMKKKKTEEEE